MKNSKMFSYLIFLFLFLGLFIQSQVNSHTLRIRNTSSEKNDIRGSGPHYSGMTMIEWDSLECLCDDLYIIIERR
ncbi:MAG: hypothetical protein HWN80_19055 [Candidatus Lokiarchaeota archaeon]|nr:hypothetical protein [Candidatus Lokiarchaeota archaeon]